jgi:signal transduction histidine kinase
MAVRLGFLSISVTKRDICCNGIKEKLYIFFGIWLIPVILVMLEGAFMLARKDMRSPYIIYFMTFWIVRAVLAPLIVLYTLKFWSAHKRVFYLFLLHAAGFLLFSVLFWSLTYLTLNNLLERTEIFGVKANATSIQVFAMIVDNSLSTNSVVYVSTVAFCYVWEFFRQNISINKRAMELERSLLTSRLDLLKGQLNTHFLFNTLHTISSFVVRNRNEEANKMLVRLSELLRFALKENTEQLIMVNKEITLLQLYLDIQQTRFRERLQVNIDTEPSVQNDLIPSLILQPVVENAMKYAVEPYNGTATIDISIKQCNGVLKICIKDTGMKPFHEINFNAGIGLSNTRERLKQLYGVDDLLTIGPGEAGHGVTVTINIPHQRTNNARVEDINS